MDRMDCMDVANVRPGAVPPTRRLQHPACILLGAPEYPRPMLRPPPCLVEVLETRIAPAILFLNSQPGHLQIVDASGAVIQDATHPNATAAEVGAMLAAPLLQGDSLVFDANGNHVLDAGDVTLISVSAGRALAFITDLGGTQADNLFEPNEFTGVAVSDGFAGKIGASVNGSIVTAVDGSTGNLAVSNGVLTLLPASIAGLNIDGQVVGNIFTGNSISNLVVTGAHPLGADIRSVTGNIATGTAISNNDIHLAPDPLSLNGGGMVLNKAVFTPQTDTPGGSISNVRLDHGAHNILTGNGSGSNDISVLAHRGGSISNVTITMDSADPVGVKSGNGGDSTVGSGSAGGAISGVTIKLTVDATQSIEILSGAGGEGAGMGNGGAGGAISGCSIIANGSIAGSIFMSGGAGGGSQGIGSGGAGGALSQDSVVTNGSISTSVKLTGGDGGSAFGIGSGGAGGAIADTIVQALGAGKTVQSLLVRAGDGGASRGGHAGPGGALTNDTVLNEATIGSATADSSFEVGAGSGGTGFSFGGNGGALTGVVVTLDGAVNTSPTSTPPQVFIHSGNGGDLQSTAAGSAAGKGGGITSLDVTQFADLAAGILVKAGNGGSGQAALRGDGGAGGFVTASDIFGARAASTDLTMVAGNGGNGAPGGKGGGGGSVSKILIDETSAIHSITVHGGGGGNGTASGGSFGGGGGGSSASTAAGGAGGALSSISLTTDSVSDGVRILAGGGGGSSGIKGGAGGAISAFSFENTGPVTGGIQLLGGAGGASDSGAGGVGGALSNITLTNGGGASHQVAGTNIPFVSAIDLEGGAGGSASGHAKEGPVERSSTSPSII